MDNQLQKAFILTCSKYSETNPTCCDGPARGVEVHVDRLGGVLRLEKEKLGYNNVSGVVGNGTVDANDSFFEKS